MNINSLCKLMLVILTVSFSFSCQTKKETPKKHTASVVSDIIANEAKLKVESADFDFTEGPAVAKNGDVYFTDQPNDRILKWSAESGTIETFLQPASRSNGLYFDHSGNLLACADEKFEMLKISPDKEQTVIWKGFEGNDLNGPNDLWLDPKGGIYFTDPYYQRPYWTRETKEIKTEGVYYISSDYSSIQIVDTNLVQANGIVGDGEILYVADIGAKKTYRYDIVGDGQLANRQLFVEQGSDGMTLDNEGNLYLTGKGVHVYNPKGELIKHIPIEQDWTANVVFGGKNQKILFITAMNTLYSLEMNVHGIR